MIFKGEVWKMPGDSPVGVTIISDVDKGAETPFIDFYHFPEFVDLAGKHVIITIQIGEDKLEKLAELEHIQWIEWSKNIASTEVISQERLERWKKLWIPYNELTEEQKEQDRIYARKILEIL